MARWKVALGSVALAFGAAELGWRIYLPRFASPEHVGRWGRLDELPPDALKIRPHPYLAFGLNPDYRSSDGRNRHGWPGVRGEDVPPKVPGELRIVCVGGSTTYDSEIHDWRDAWPAQLERRLRALGHDEVRVVNAGVAGYTSWETLANVTHRLLPLEPDLLIVHHAMNDVPPRLMPPDEYRADNTGYRTAWLEDRRWWDHSRVLHWLGVQTGFSARNTLEDRLQRARIVDEPLAWLDANPPIHFERNLRSLVALARTHGCEPLFLTWPWAEVEGDLITTPAFRRGVAEHNELVLRLAGDLDVPCFDLAAAMPGDRSYWVEGRHNNERGARRKAELVAEWLDASPML